MDVAIKCGECNYFILTRKPHAPRSGECHFNAPAPHVANFDNVKSHRDGGYKSDAFKVVWPEVDADRCFCGQLTCKVK